MVLPKHVFFEGNIVPFNDAKISVATHALHYGTGVFGGLRGYWNEDKGRLYIFRPYDHYRRLLNSGRMMHMSIPYDEESLIQLTLDLIRMEGWQEDIYIRPLIYKADLGIGVRLHDLKDELKVGQPAAKFIAQLGNPNVRNKAYMSYFVEDHVQVKPAVYDVSAYQIQMALNDSDIVTKITWTWGWH